MCGPSTGSVNAILGVLLLALPLLLGCPSRTANVPPAQVTQVVPVEEAPATKTDPDEAGPEDQAPGDKAPEQADQQADPQPTEGADAIGDAEASPAGVPPDAGAQVGDAEAAEDAQDPPAEEDVTSSDDPSVEKTPVVPAERFMLLTQSGPLLADVRITIEGAPFREAFEKVLEDVLAIADEDGDGRVTWEQIMAHPRFRSGQFGNPATTTYQAQQDMIRLYDSTSNGRVDPDELVRYLTSNQGTARPLTLLTSNWQRGYNRDKSALRQWLDTNGDLALDAEEIAGAARRLRLRDADDDEILTREDFADPASLQPGGAPRRPRIIGPPKAAWRIAEDESWEEMLAGWETLYCLGNPVRAGDLMLGDRLFAQLDIDEDGELAAFEMEMLTDVEPDMEFEVELGRGEASGVEVRLAALRIPVEETEGVIQHQPNRLTVQLADTTVDIFAADTIGDAQYEQQAMAFLMRADGDKNSYLSEEEFGAVAQQLNVDFAAADLDENEMVFQDEIETLLQQRNIASRRQLRIKADDQEDALWQTLDANADGRIDSREIARAKDLLLALDADEDGQVQLHELRGSMMIGLVRGANAPGVPGDRSFQVPTVVHSTSDSTPRWFAGMDRNQDQGISWREFLGAREQFDALDRDGDGFVEVDELDLAPTADAESAGSE